MKRGIWGIVIGGLALLLLLLIGFFWVPQWLETETDAGMAGDDAWEIATRSCVFVTQGGDDNTPNYTDCAEEATARPGDRVWFYHQLTQARRTGGTVEYTNQTGSPAARPILFSSRLSFAVQLGQVLGETLADEVLDACEATNMNWPTGVAEGIKLTDRSPVYTSINATGSLGEGANALPLCQFVVPELNQSLRLESLLDFGPEEDFEVTRAIVNLAP